MGIVGLTYNAIQRGNIMTTPILISGMQIETAKGILTVESVSGRGDAILVSDDEFKSRHHYKASVIESAFNTGKFKVKDGSKPTIHVEARRWFQKSYGNTYHSVFVFLNGDIQNGKYVGSSYGGGDQWEETAAELITAAGWVPARYRHDNGAYEPFGKWLERHGVILTEAVIDVQRKRDL